MSYRDRSSTASHLDGARPDANNAPPPQLQPITLGLVPEVICRSFGIPSDNAANQYLQRYPYEAPASFQQHPYERLAHYGDRGSHHMAFCTVAPSAQMNAYGHGAAGAYQGLPGYGPHPHMFSHGLNAHMLGGQGFLLPQDMQLHLQQLQQAQQQQQQHAAQQQPHHHHHHHHHQQPQQPQAQQQQPPQQPHEVLSDPHHQHMRQALYAQMHTPDYTHGQHMAMPGRGTKRPNGERELPLQPLKRSRVVWTKELHQRFEEALEKAGGIDVAVPKTVLEYMAIPGLTRDNVASHLQKHRIQMKRKDGQQASTATAQRSQQDQGAASTGPSGSHALTTDAAKAEPSAAATDTDAPTTTARVRPNGEVYNNPSVANDTNTVDNLTDKLDTAGNGPPTKGVTSGNNGDTSGNMTSESGKTVFLGANFRSPGHATTLGSEETGDATRTRLNGGFGTANNGATTKRMDKCSTLGLNASEREDATSADTGQAVAAERDVPSEQGPEVGHAEATYA